MKRYSLLFLLSIIAHFCIAQQLYELNSGWVCANIKDVNTGGDQVSSSGYSVRNWMPATVPGTVLTTMLNNKLVPDPFYGLNNEKIQDVFATGPEFYTYWFVKDFKEKAGAANEQTWLNLRGVNYKCEIYLNGKKVNAQTHEGMHLRQQYNITSYLARDGNNRLAIIVYPPTVVGNPNGGQGGDGTIAKNLTHQYVAGWDWIQPIRDRNTGIWDKVFIEKTKSINLKNPHVVTLVPGKRLPAGPQEPAIVKLTAELENPLSIPVTGILQYELAGNTIKKQVTIPAKKTIEIALPAYQLKNPKLWWPNGYGEQNLYTVRLKFTDLKNAILDKEDITVGVRQIDNQWNEHTRSMQTSVNGQKIFIKGGNWIISDAMLRFSDDRYDAEIRYHRDMNLNLIRIWGGAITERPEFYEACDRYGMLVFQDFWFSGDCNGRWTDPKKKDDQWTRRRYPDNHELVLTAAADQIKMIRNHPSLAFWCGGNEISPPEDILIPLKKDLLPRLDGTRYFFEYSNTDSMSYNSLGGNGDGPYGIQDPKTFWQSRTFPFNSEVGSVGVGDYASLQRFIPEENLVAPQHGEKIDEVWKYHKYIGYDQYIDPYGRAKNAEDFVMKAQLVNYDQYRALIEGFTAHMWDWYTGTIIWKTQNPWTALRGQMYDYYLDVNACLYGLRTAGKPVHIMFNPADSMSVLVNQSFTTQRSIMVDIRALDMNGKETVISQAFSDIEPGMVRKLFSLNRFIKNLNKEEGLFISMRLLDANKNIIDDNFYWLPGKDGNYTGLQHMTEAKLQITAKAVSKTMTEVRLTNPAGGPVAFFNRIALINPETGKRILPAFFSDNYLSVLPGESKTIYVECSEKEASALKNIEVYGWNTGKQVVKL